MSLRATLNLAVLVTAIVAPYAIDAQTSAQSNVDSSQVVSVPKATAHEIASITGGAQASIYSTPPTLTLIPHSPQGHPGEVWLRSTDEGLHIWGKVQAEEKGFHWPEEKSEMLSSDHVEVWLATSPEVTMPAIGWGNQFGETTLAAQEDCDKKDWMGKGESSIGNCKHWYNKQIQYRNYLQRLFLRQWLIAGSGQPMCCSFRKAHFFEDFAATAWSGLNASIFSESLPIALRPKPDDGVVAETDDDLRQVTRNGAAGKTENWNVRSGYFYHLFIPYTAFPPAQQLKLTDLYFAVEVFGAASDGHKIGEHSSTTPSLQWGKPTTFNHLRLAAPRTFSYTPCDYKVEQDDIYGAKHDGWFLPTASPEDSIFRTTVALVNHAEGYLYEPGGMSPEAAQATYFWKELANGTTICGPRLAWRSGTTIQRSKFVVEDEKFEAKPLPDGWNLIRSGPSTFTLSPFGAGQCGSCMNMNFDIFAVSPQGEITSALHLAEDLRGEGDFPSGADLSIASDWKSVILYREFEDPNQENPKPQWNSITYCLQGHAYKQCGEAKGVKPPEPANFIELRSE